MMLRSMKLCVAAGVTLASLSAYAQKQVSEWLTTGDKSVLFQEQAPLHLEKSGTSGLVIDVDEAKTYQTMDGFGFALTGGSAQLIHRMDADKRAALLKELFATDGNNIGVSYLRISVGSSDMNDHVYSYDDLPQGETDPTMAKFSIEPDRADVIPVLKEILAINPKVKILASPWSAPLWMKTPRFGATSGGAKGGVLKPQYFGAYAIYFVKYIQAMKDEGIAIDTLTVQNEPLNENNTPAMLMLESEQADFIENHLGPAFQKAGIKTKIVLYDHNLDHPAYPLAILKDPKANKYVDGTGFHLYGGEVEAFDQVHDAFPNKNLYFTEQSVTEKWSGTRVAKPVAWIVIGATRHWSRNVLLWNLAADPQFGPHTNDGGCTECQGAITIDGDNVTRNIAYYTIAHASKFVRPGSVRVGSNNADALPNVAFKTPEGKTVLLVANTSDATKEFSVRHRGETFTARLTSGAVGTYIW
jgi:glucosylceramidase